MKSLLIVFLILFTGCTKKDNSQSTMNETQKINLLENNNLDKWTFYLTDSTVSPDLIWSVKNGIVLCTGSVNGYMRTKQKFSNYKLSLDWRWPGEPGNSGVLLHITGKDKVWPKCIEAQLMSGTAGDFFLIDSTDINERLDKTSNRVEKKNESSENAPGEWNHYEIVCSGDSIMVYVNDVLQNQASGASVSKGWIGLQSEGAPIEFRNISIELLKP